MILGLFAKIPLLHGAQITHHSGINFARLLNGAFGTLEMFAFQIAVSGTDTESGR